MTTPPPPILDAPPPSVPALLRRYFGPLLGGIFLLRLAVLCVWLGMIIPEHPDLSFPEGALVARAMDVARGESPYHDWRIWPHAFAPYPPLAYYPVGWIARAVAGPAPAPHTVYMAGRAFSLAMILGIFALVYLFGRRLGLSRVWSLVAVAVIGEHQGLLEYCTSFRPDAPQVFFALLALWIAVRFPFRRRVAAAGLAALYVALWFKPTAWGVGVVLAVWVWRGLGLRRAGAVGLGFAAAGLVPLWLLNRHWDGLLWLNIVDSLRNGVTLAGLANLVQPTDFPKLQLVLIGGIIGAAILGLRGRRSLSSLRDSGLLSSANPALKGGAESESSLRDCKERDTVPETGTSNAQRTTHNAQPTTGNLLLSAALFASLAASLLQLLKIGGDINYFFAVFPLAALFTVWGIARLWHGRGGRRAWLREGVLWGVVLPLALLSAWDNFSTLRDSFRTVMIGWKPMALQGQVARAGGPVLTTNPFIALSSPAPTVMDFYQYSVLCRRGMLDPEPLRERLRRREFAMVVLSDSLVGERREPDPDSGHVFFCPGFYTLLNQNYQLRSRNPVFQVLVPRPPAN